MSATAVVPIRSADEADQREPLLETAAPTSRLLRAGAQANETILPIGISGHGLSRFIHLDPPELIRSWKIANLFSACRQATFITAPSMRTPAVTYFHSATRSLRASATMIVFFMRPPLRLTRSLNHRASADCR